jgi:outer membrane protein assembly factor BamB
MRHSIIFTCVAAAVFTTHATSTAQPPYADTAWRTIHATSRNNDYVPTSMAQRYANKWRVLDGLATVMGPSIGPEGNLYITTPSPKGTSALYALDSDGNILWQSDPWNGPTGLDSCAGYQTPIIDDQGDVYLSDCNQLWSFSSDGTLRWAIDLPAPPEGAAWQNLDASPVNSFITAMFTNDGSVGGITIWGDIVLVSRTDGAKVADVIKMPGSVVISDEDLPTSPLEGGIPPGLWQPDFMDQQMISPIWFVFEGLTPGANTPAVEPTTGRIYSTGFSEPLDDDLGALYGFDFTPGADGALGTIAVAINFEMGSGSGSSPALSPDGSVVYVSDGEGVLYGVDARTGMENWRVQTDGQAASPSVAPDGKIHLLGGKAGSAYNSDGTKAWEANLDDLAATLVPPLDPDSTLEGPSTFNNAIPTVTDTGIVTSVTVGYLTEAFGRVVPLPVMQIVVMLDADTGELIDGYTPFEIDDSIDGFVIPSFEGTVYVNNGALSSSTISASAPLLGWDQELPEGVSIMQPIGGLQAFTPAQESSGGGCSIQATPSTPTTLVLLLTLATATLLRRKRGQSPFSKG